LKRVLVTGAGGQIGTELVAELRSRLGAEAVLATDIRRAGETHVSEGGPYRVLDCTDGAELAHAIIDHGADTVYHLAAILSAVAEERPHAAYRVNLGGLYALLEVAREARCKLFVPSSIAAFGPGTPPDPAPQDTIQRPTSMYGVTKVAGELLCDYYHLRYDVDVRGVRYPGLISHGAPPGGGTTDYAVEIFYRALDSGRYTCFLSEDTQLDMMYMPDAIRAAIELMEADADRLVHRNAFNVTAMQLTPRRLADAIRQHIPEFEIDYDVDPVRQGIAESWPRSIDDSAAREEWDWKPEFDLDRMTSDMLEQLSRKLGTDQH
jgi:nucleoside-diphosphate-sugar epimerase